ncbi:APC family permease [Streptomyces sp. 2-6]|uniref:APC family permease n=1 Tax=Streptomyces sp. 2-6 TaxID=2978333 RepID=UPI003D0FBA54
MSTHHSAGSHDSAPSAEPGTARARTLTTGRVVFLVIAAAAPMAGLIGTVPLALIRGNGIALPSAYLLAGIALLCFCAAYSAMTRRVANQGAFYLLVARGLGKPPAAATAYAATLGYTALAIGLPASFGYFTSLVLASAGVGAPWWLCTAAAVVIGAVLGHRNVETSTRVLGVLMVLEFAVLIVLDVLVVQDHGAAAFPMRSFSPDEIAGGSLGIGAMFAFAGFVGFESAALYGEETKDPERSIPRAAFTAVGAITVFYVVTSALLIGGAGGRRAPDMARREVGDFVFALAERYGGTVLYDATAVLLCTSLLASYLALHNAASRYVFALGRESFLPRRLGRHHPRHLSPHLASITVAVLTAVVISVLGLAGADPYLMISAGLIGLGTLAIISVQAVTALAVLAFYWRRPDRHWFTGIVAPALGASGLASGIVLVTVHYDTLTGTDDIAVNLVPALLPVAAAAGVAVALRLRRTRPAVYASFAASRLRERTDAAVTRPEATATRKS